MPASAEHQPIQFDVYVASDAEGMTRLLGEVFSRHDPPAVAVGLTPFEFEGLVRLFCPKGSTRPNWKRRRSDACAALWLLAAGKKLGLK